MQPHAAPSGTDAFERYFQAADADRDGRINEALFSFFPHDLSLLSHSPQGIAVWQYADSRQAGFLHRPEFFHALRLITVAQSGRDINPDVARATFSGPAVAQIPAPRITVPPRPGAAARPGGLPGPVGSGAPGPGAPGAPPVQQGAYGRGMPVQGAPMPQGMAGMAGMGPVGGMMGGMGGMGAMGPGPGGMMGGMGPRPGMQQPQQHQQVLLCQQSASRPAPPTSTLPKSADAAAAAALDAFVMKDVAVVPPAAVSSAVVTAGGGQAAEGTAFAGAGAAAGAAGQGAGAAAGGAQGQEGEGFLMVPGDPQPWPRMGVAEAQRYAQVFVGIDADRDGKITGKEARKVLMASQVPIDVLKQVWDLSDEDKDGNLTLREFCTASYLIERYKSGRKLPPTLPKGFHVDEPVQDQRTAIAAKRLAEAQAALTQHSQGVNVPTWQRDPGRDALAHSATNLLPNLMLPHTSLRLPVVCSDAAMDQKKKAVFFRDKMQEIVMFKSRCDLRLADVSEQADVEKKEMEELARKYDDKYKAAQLSAGKLAAEERALQQMQEKAHIIMNATSRLDRGGDPNQLLQDKADRLALEVEEMRKVVFAHATAVFSAAHTPSWVSCAPSTSHHQDKADRLALEVEEMRKAVFAHAPAVCPSRYSSCYLTIQRPSLLDLQDKADRLALEDKADRLALEVEEMRKAVFAHATAIGLKVRPLVGSETPFGWQANLQEKATDWDDEWDDVQFEELVVVRDIGDTPLAENEDPFPRPKSKEQEEKGAAGASAAAETGKGEGEEGGGEGEVEDGKGGEGMAAEEVDGAANTGGEGPGGSKENGEKEKQEKEKEEEKKRKKKEKSMGSAPSGPADFFSPEEDEDADSNEAMIGVQRHGEEDEDEEEEEVEEIVMDSTPVLQITAGGEGEGGGRGRKDGMMEGVVAGGAGAGAEEKQTKQSEAGAGGKEGEREGQETDGENSTSAVQEESAASASPGDSKEILGFPFQGWSRGSAGKAGAAAGGAGGRGSGGAAMPSLADLASSFSLSPTSGVSPVSPVSAAASTSSRASTTASPFNPASVAKSLAAANAAAAAINAASGTPDSTPAGVAAGGDAAALSAGKSPPSATSVRRTLDLGSVDSPQQDSTASGASSAGGLGFGSVMTAGPGGRYSEGAGAGAGAGAGVGAVAGGGGGRDGYGEGEEVSRPYTAHGLVSEDMVESDAESDSGRKGYGSGGRGRDEEEDEQAADSSDTAAPAAGIPAAATAAAAAAAATAAPAASFGLSPSADSEGGAAVTETKSGSFAFDFSAEPEDPFTSGAAAAADRSESASPFPTSFSTEGRRRSGNDEAQSPLTHAAEGQEDSPIHSQQQQQLGGAADTFESSPFHANPVDAAPFDASQFDQGFGRDSSFGRDPSFSRDSSFKGYGGSIFDSATGAASFKGGFDASAFDSATGAASFKGGFDASTFDQHYGGVGAFDQHYGAGGAALDTSSSFRSSVDSPSGSHARSGEFHPGQFQSFASGFDDHFDSNPYGASAGTVGGGGGRGRGEEEEEVHSSEEEDSGGDPFANLRSSGGGAGGNQHVTASHFDAYNYDKAAEEAETPGAARQGGVQPAPSDDASAASSDDVSAAVYAAAERIHHGDALSRAIIDGFLDDPTLIDFSFPDQICGTWHHNYTRMHQQIRAASKNPSGDPPPDTPPVKFLTFDGLSHCDSLGETLMGLTSAFTVAILTNRAFVIKHPCIPMAFEPALIDWQPTEDVGFEPVRNETFPLEHPDRAVTPPIGASDIVEINLELRPEAHPEKVFLQVEAARNLRVVWNKDLLVHMLKGANESVWGGRLKDMGVSIPYAFGCFVRYLLRPKPEVWHRMQPFEKQLRGDKVVSIGMHVRHFGRGSLPPSTTINSGDLRRAMNDIVWPAIKCAKDVENWWYPPFLNVKWLIISDSLQLKQKAAIDVNESKVM
ncbi:unnamed protein product [Closterium sp. NIES-65]|nr:unnamed protein product [Closterium sp. NIES-65]